MKKLLIILAISVICSSAEAAQRKIASTQSVTGPKAQALYEALSSGGIGDCAAGTCGAEVSALNCVMNGNSVNKRTYSCTYNGNASFPGNVAKNLYKALSDVTQSDCAEGTCGSGVITDLNCTMHGNSVDQRTYDCQVSQ